MPCYDFSDVLFKQVRGEQTPSLRMGKFVVVEVGSDLHVGFSPIELSKFHANIADRICKQLGLTGRYDARKEHFTPHDDFVRSVGGGKWQIDEQAGVLDLWGDSQAYGPVAFEIVTAALADDWPFGCDGCKVRLPAE